MKKLFTALVALIASVAGASAQLGVFNHLGVDASISTTGLGVELSTPITDFMQLRAGASFIPSVTFKTDIDGTLQVSDGTHSANEPFNMQIKGDVGRTQGDVILNVYPFGKALNLFVAGGVYFGGESLVKLEGHSDRVAQLQNSGTLQQGWVEIGDYKVDFEENGNIRGALTTKKTRPYLGLGYGRPCPGGRLGFMVELGVQFTGKMKVCQGRDLTPIDISDLGNDDDWQKVIDKVSAYPVLKLTLSGRIF